MYIRKSDFLKEDYFFYVHAALSSFHILSGIDGSLYGFQEKCQGKFHPEKIQKTWAAGIRLIISDLTHREMFSVSDLEVK